MPPQLPPLPADAVLVHIGPHKTGTTAIQTTLAASRPALAAHGVQYPGNGSAHHRAARALRQISGGWEHDHEAVPDLSVWTRLAERVRDTPGRVVLSSEFFAQSDAETQSKLIQDLGPERVHLLTGARNPAAIAVSTWQQVLRQGRPVTLDDWLKNQFHRTEESTKPGPFWSFADSGLLTSSWAQAISPERITVIALDEGDRQLLPSTFEQLLDLPAGLLAGQEAVFANRGLNAAEAAFISSIIEVLDSRLTWAEYTRVMRKGVLRRVLERRPGPDEPKVALPAWAVEQAAAEAERSIEKLRQSGVRIVGNLDSLRPARPAGADAAPSTDVPLEIAVEAVVGAVAVALRDSWSLDAPPPAPRPTPARTPPPPPEPAPTPPPPATQAPEKRSPGHPADAIPTRDLALLLGKRVRSGLGRRYRRWRRGRGR